MDEFNQFTKAHTCKETLLAFRNLRTNLGLERTSCDKFFDQFGLGLNNWKVKKLFEQLRKRFSLKEYKENRSGDRSKVLVVGAGPCGLRIAIEAAFLGCEVVLIDKRNAFSRNNVLHLWPYVVTDLKNLGIKHFYSRFGCGELDHISIRRLQLSLLKIALIVGVEIHTEVEFKGLRYPKYGSHEENGWHCVCQPSSHMVSEYKFDVLIAATGARDSLCEYDLYNENDKIITKQGFERKEFRGQLSIAITANFVNENTTEEIKAKEIGGVASHFNQKLFNDLKRQKKIHLENFVYYKDETHYFVMTAKKSSLLERGVFKDSCKNKPEELMQKTNVNVNALLDFARDAANFCTHNAMPNLQFAKNSRGAEDVAMLDFSSKFEAVNASRIIERHGHQLLICLVGDSLLEPFWPQGTGCARGFLGAMDCAWMIKKWKVMKARPFDIITERESIYKVLSQTNPNNLKKKYSDYTVDPKSRYLSINLKAVGPDKAEQYYDNYDTISEQNEDVVDEGGNSGPPSKRSKSSDEIDLTDLLSWCQMVLKGYLFFSITDLTTSWRSGCELGRLIHTYRPELINLTELDPRNPLKTMSLVVDIAQKQLGIYSVIGISEMVNCSTQNEVEMASYLFQFYEMFHDEPIPQTGPTEHADMNINMNMDTIESSDTERKEVQSSDICCICRNELFILEKITVEQNMFCHRTCLKCDTCQCELNLTNYRLKRSTKGNVKFYCSRHARPRSVFKSSVRKRVYPGIRLSNKPKPSGMDNETSVPHVDNKDESLPDPVKDNPRLPERPDFLARTVTSASLRRVDFYNSHDDENDEPEEKIFQHNFGASIQGGRGMFAVVNQEQEMEEKSSSSGDDDIGELVEANIDKHVTDIDKHMTIKDANTFWQTLKRQTYKQNVVKYMETASGGSGDEIDLTDLLSWCQMVLKGYPFFSITDLTTSWRSGCELGRLIHTYRPELINLTELDPRNPLKTMSLVVDIAEKQLEIYSVIGISEMVNCSTQNEVEMASYLFQFYEMFHHEPIPQTGPTEHADMNINMNMDTIEPSDTERKEVQSSDICCICRNELFILEKITVEQNMFCHRTCLKCDTCQCELNLTNYRLKRSTKGNVKFYCSRHARPRSVFKSSVRKRVYPGIRLSNKPKPSGMDNETSVPHVDNKDESLPDPVKDNPRLPERPDFLARTVTSASLRRVDFYNSHDDENDEPEEKIFQHNFGASIQGGRGMFAVVNQEQEMEEKSSSSGDDDIGELVEANIDKHVTDIDKHMTIKDANTFWQTLKRQTYKQNVVKYMETASGGSDEIPQRGKSDVYDWDSTEDKHNDKTGDKVDLSQLQPISDEEDMSADQRDNTQSDNIRRNSDLLEKKIKELNRESKELKDRRYKFSATCYRPARKLAVKEGAGDYKPSKVTPHKKPHFKRSNSDQTEVRHAQRVQCAARKIARQRQENAFFLAQEIARQLEEAEIKLEEVEKEGVEIEKALKEDIKTPEKDKPKLRRMLCSLYSRRQILLQYEAELRAANEQFITSHIVIQKDEVDVLQSISSDDDEEGDYVMIKNPNTLETGLNKQTTPAMAKADITHDATERNKSSSPNTTSIERTTAPPIYRTNKPTNRGITGVAEDTHVYDTGNGSNTPFNEEQNLIDEFQNIGIVPYDWECTNCTLKNKEADFYCDACLAWKCSVCTFVNVLQQKKCKMCENNRPSEDQSEDNRSGNLMPKFT